MKTLVQTPLERRLQPRRLTLRSLSGAARSVLNNNSGFYASSSFLWLKVNSLRIQIDSFGCSVKTFQLLPVPPFTDLDP